MLIVPKSKAQFAIEFATLMAFMFFVFVGFVALSATKVLESREDERQRIAQDIAELAKSEIDLGLAVADGYKREFELPVRVKGSSYGIEIIDDRELVVTYLDKEHVIFLPDNVRGNLTCGTNTIERIEGIVYLEGNPVQLLVKENGVIVMSIDNDGNLILVKGNLLEIPNPPTPPGQDLFVIRHSGDAVAVLRLDNGNFQIHGQLFQNQMELNPPQTGDNFIVINSCKEVVAYIDNDGNLYLKGSCTKFTGSSCL